MSQLFQTPGDKIWQARPRLLPRHDVQDYFDSLADFNLFYDYKGFIPIEDLIDVQDLGGLGGPGEWVDWTLGIRIR